MKDDERLGRWKQCGVHAVCDEWWCSMQSSSHSLTAILIVMLVAQAETLSLRGVLYAWMRVWADKGRAEPRSEGIVCVYVYVILLCVSVCVYVCTLLLL